MCRFNATITAENLVTFATQVADGTLLPERMSEDIPEDDMDGDVRIVVGDSFDEIVRDPTKDVLIEVYAPWCGHCQALEPTYHKLATRFKDVSSVVIAKMDGTKNEHAAIDVEGFPSIYFFPAADKLGGVQPLIEMCEWACRSRRHCFARAI